MATSREANLRLEAQLSIAPSLPVYTVTAGAWVGNVATLTIGTHLLSVGNMVVVSAVSPTGYNGLATVTAIAATTFSYALTVNPGAWSSGGKVTDRVQLGLVDIPGGYDFFSSLVTNPYAVVLPARNTEWNGQQRHTDIQIAVNVWFGAAGDANLDFTAIEDTWVAIRNALRAGGASGPPDSMNITGPTPRSDLKPMAFLYEIEMSYPSS